MNYDRVYQSIMRLIACMLLPLILLAGAAAQSPIEETVAPAGQVRHVVNFLPNASIGQSQEVNQSDANSELIAIPLSPTGNQANNNLSVEAHGALVSIYADAVDLRIVLAHLAEESGVNIVVAESVDAKVSTLLKQVSLWDALNAILRINGLVWTQQDNIIFVTRPVGSNPTAGSSGSVPGQSLRVFDLNYTSAAEVLEVVRGLLSPAGKAFVHSVDISSARQTRERVVVEDFADRLETIAQYLSSVDNAPRQVLIEAHVLQVTLEDDERHGFNLDALARISGARLRVWNQGFTPNNPNPGFMVGLDSGDLDTLLECLKSNSRVRTLAAPKVLVVNGQEARIQIGSKFGYFVTTTTQTSTLQNVDFLDIGVVLQVQPTITDDGQVMLQVQPKVSGGRINPDSGLPEEDTTEATTTVLLPDGQGMVIGGLIKEETIAQQTWIPWLGEMRWFGGLFRRSNDKNKRVEVILALTPHIVPFGPEVYDQGYNEYAKATRNPERYFMNVSPEMVGGLDYAPNGIGNANPPVVTGASYRP